MAPPVKYRIIQLPVEVISQSVTVTTTGTAVQLPAKRLFSGVTIKPDPDNVGDKIFIGPSTVDSGDFSISKADKEKQFVECEELSEIWVDADTSGDKVLILGG